MENVKIPRVKCDDSVEFEFFSNDNLLSLELEEMRYNCHEVFDMGHYHLLSFSEVFLHLLGIGRSICG